MKLGDKVFSNKGIECEVIDIYQDSIYTMVRAEPVNKKNIHDQGRLCAFTDRIETVEKRNKEHGEA